VNVCIIPARGGSKRIPKKNIREFCGKPIIAYSIDAAKKSGLFEHVFVSTDSEEIANIAREYGAEVPFIRPDHLANDYTGTDAVVLHALSWLKEKECRVDYVCCIYATAPFILPDYIQHGYLELKNANALTALSVTTFPYCIFRSLKMTIDNRVEMIWPDNFPKRSQDFPEAYHDAGQFYWADAGRYLEGKSFFSEDTLPIVLPRHCVQDIDTEEDWVRAEIMFKAERSQEI